MKNIDLTALLSSINSGAVKVTTFNQATKDNKEKQEAAMKEYDPLIKQIRSILVDKYGPKTYPIEINDPYQTYGFRIVLETGPRPFDNKYLRVYNNVYDGQAVYSIFNDKIDKSKVVLTLFEQLMAGRDFPSYIMEAVIDRYIKETNEFEFFEKFEKSAIPQQLKDFFVKTKTYKDTKEQRLCKSYYGYLSKTENSRKQTSFSFSPSKVEIVLLRDEKGGFVPGFLFNLPVLSTLKFKYAVPMFSDNMEASIDELFEKFNAKFIKCVVNIIGRAENLKLKEKKLMMTLPRAELIGRLKVTEMLTY
jgi:hypothetical protein